MLACQFAGHHIAPSVVGTEKMAVGPCFLAKQAR